MIRAAGSPKITAFNWPLLPFYALQVFTGHKSFETPVIGNETFNRRGLHVWRMKLASRMTEWRRRRLGNIVTAEERATFDRDGFFERQNFLAPQEHAALIAELRSLTAEAREMKEGHAVTRRIACTPELLQYAPVLRRFLDNPDWKRLTRYVGSFNAEPVICIQTIFGAAGAAAASDPQTQVHMDTFHPTMKAWYFLEDVGWDQGPFTYVPGSNRLSPRRMAWHRRRSVVASQGTDKGGSFRVPDVDLPRLHLPPRRIFAVPGNTLVVGDTFGLHARGQSLRPSTRVEIYASMRPNPFSPFVSLGTDVIPFVRGRKLAIGWWFEDMLARLGLARQVWKKAGNLNPWLPEPGA